MQDEAPAQPLVVARALGAAADHAADSPATAELLYRQVLEADPGNAEARAGLGDARARVRRRARRAARQTIEGLAQQPRIWKYRLLSSCPHVTGSAIELQPVLFVGAGRIALGHGVQFGWRRSPLFYTGYCHVEAGHPDALIELGDRVEFNNNAMLKSEGPGIRVGRDALFGAHVEIFDSNFHDLDPRRRHGGQVRMGHVDIGENTFVGMSVKVLKGVTIGADSVIGAGAVVSSSIPAGVIAAGNPARVVRAL